jgi:cyclohexanecarboxyl-CoA dehydrogenase
VVPWLDKLTPARPCAIALTEPRGGSDAANLRLRVERVGDHSAQRREDLDLGRRPGDIAVVFGRTGTVSPAPMA